MTVSIISTEWLRALPKAENHVHLEGCLDPAVVVRAAQRVGVATPTGIPSSLDELLLLDTDLVNEYRRCIDAFGWSSGDLVTVAEASIRASSASTEVRDALLAELADFAEPLTLTEPIATVAPQET